MCLCMASPIPRLRAGLCDRCMVTQELARKKQLELESAHLQSLQHLCILSELSPQSRAPRASQPTQNHREGKRHGTLWFPDTWDLSGLCLFSVPSGGIPTLLTFLGCRLGLANTVSQPLLGSYSLLPWARREQDRDSPKLWESLVSITDLGPHSLLPLFAANEMNGLREENKILKEEVKRLRNLG